PRASRTGDDPPPGSQAIQLDVSTTRALTRDLEIHVQMDPPPERLRLSRGCAPLYEREAGDERFGDALPGGLRRLIEEIDRQVCRDPAGPVHIMILTPI